MIMTWRIALRLLRQDGRSGELHLLAAALVLTVAAITAVGFFTDRVESAMNRQGGDLIAADLLLEATTPLPASYREQAERMGLATAQTIGFRSVLMGEQGPQLVEVKAVDSAYPLRGQLKVRDGFDAPERAVPAGPPAGQVWVESRLLLLLEAELGELVGLGASQMPLGAILGEEPDRAGALFAFAPRVMMHLADLEATGLISEASRAEHRLLVAGDARTLASFQREVQPLPANLRLVDSANARPEFASAVERAGRFLHLATLVTLLVAGAAIALASHRFVERQTDAVAILRCLGAPHHLLRRVFLLRLVLFGLLASLAGCVLGWLGQLGLLALLADWFPADLPPASLAPVLAGVATGLVALLGFALPPLLQLAQVTPLRVLRRDLGPPRGSAILAVAGEGPRRRQGRRLIHRVPGLEAAILGTLLPQDAGQAPGVDVGDAGHAAAGQVPIQWLLKAPVARPNWQVADDETRRLDAGGFLVLRVDADVAYMGIGQSHQLAAVGGIGKDLLVTGHGGVEDHLADALCLGADG